MSSGPALEALVLRLASAITITGGRRGGDPETRVRVNRRLPSTEQGARAARWLVVTEQRRLYRAPISREPLSVWHRADGMKGRRLAVYDLANESRIAALLSWHFATGRGRAARSHLVTSAAARADDAETVRAQDMEALGALFAVVLAIDAMTIRRREVRLALDSAIELTPAELERFGFRRGAPSHGGSGYWRLAMRSW